MSPKLKIALTWPASTEDVYRYQTYVSSKCKIVAPKGARAQDLIEVAEDADVIAGGYVPAFMITHAKKLRMVQVTHAGAIASNPLEPDLDQVYLGFSLKMLKGRGILMGNIHGNSILVAEHAVAFMLVLAKRVIEANQAVSTGRWFPFTPDNRSAMIMRSTVGIIGLGSIGKEVAKRIKPFGARIIALKRTSAPPLVRELGLEFLGGPGDLPKLLSESDFLILTVPLTQETHQLIGERELRMMKKNAYLINVARAELVKEEAIYKP